MAKVIKRFINDGIFTPPAGVTLITARKIFNIDGMFDEMLQGQGLTTGWHFITQTEDMVGLGPNSGFNVALGTGSFGTDASVPTAIAGGIKWARSAEGISNYGGLSKDGDLYLWGTNQGGSIGNNTSTLYYSAPQLVAGGHKWKDARAPWGIDVNSDLYMWGYNNNGCLGNGISPGSVPMYSVPQLVIGKKKWRWAYTTGNLAFGIDQNGDGYAWGPNYDALFADNALDGQLGAGLDPSTVRAVSSPVLIAGGKKWQAIYTMQPTFGLTQDGQVYAWGRGDMGNGAADIESVVSSPFLTITYKAYSTPTLVLSSFGKIAKLYPFRGFGGPFYFITADGTLYGWGAGDPQLGNGDPNGSSTPVVIKPGTKFKSVSYGNSSAYWAIDQDDNCWAWGMNYLGLLGIGVFDPSFDYVSTPTLVAGGRKWRFVMPTGGGIVGQTTDGTLYVWGTTVMHGAASANLSSPTLVANSQRLRIGSKVESRTMTVVPGQALNVYVNSTPRVGTQFFTDHFADAIEIEYDV